MTIINAHLDKVSPEAKAAWLRLIKRDGKIRRTAPDWRKDPHAWAAWQGYRTACGWHGEGATFKLLMLDEPARKTWDQISDLVIACRRAVAAGRVTFTVEASA